MALEDDWGTVLDLLPDGTVNVQAPGTVYEAVENGLPGYVPAQNDRVLVHFVKNRGVLIAAPGGALTVPRASITITDTTPSGSGNRQVTSWWQDTTAGDAAPRLIGVRSSPPPPPTTAPHVAVPTGAGTWDEVNGWAAGDVLQGQVAEFPHPRYGLWLYPSLTSATTVTKLQITVSRQVGSGPGGNVSLRFYLHNYTTPPTSQPTLVESFDGNGGLTLSPGAVDTFTLPTAWGVLLRAGTRAGVAVFSSDSDDYGRFDGPAASGVLTFTEAI